MAEPELLDRLVTILDASARDGGWHQPHRLVFVERPDDGELVLGVKDLEDGDHPMEHLLGLVAPDEWFAFGLVSFGWASPLPDDASGYRTPIRPSEHPERVRVRSVFLVSRDGGVASTAELADGRVIDTPGQGVVADAMRRALGIETAPPEEPVIALLTAMWLEEALAAVEEWRGRDERGRGPSWADLASLHPVLARARAGGVRVPASRLAEVGRLFAENISWADLRWESMTGAAPWGIEVDPEIAAWMDEGMYARWLLADHGAVADLAARVASVVAPACAAKLEACLQQWGFGVDVLL